MSWKSEGPVGPNDSPSTAGGAVFRKALRTFPPGSPLPAGFARFHQSVFERFVCEAISLPLQFFSYYQGYSDALEPLYFTFLKEEYLLPSMDIPEYVAFLAEAAEDPDDIEDFRPISDDFNMKSMFYDYDLLLGCAKALSEKVLYPFLHPDNQIMVEVVKLAFEPVLRLVDSELYAIMGRNTYLSDVCQGVFMSYVISAGVHESDSPYTVIRFLDAAVAGGWVFVLFVSVAAVSLTFRLCAPSIFYSVRVGTGENDNLYHAMLERHYTGRLASESGPTGQNSHSNCPEVTELTDNGKPLTRTGPEMLTYIRQTLRLCETCVPEIADCILRLAFTAALYVECSFAGKEQSYIQKYVYENFYWRPLARTVDQLISQRSRARGKRKPAGKTAKAPKPPKSGPRSRSARARGSSASGAILSTEGRENVDSSQDIHPADGLLVEESPAAFASSPGRSLPPFSSASFSVSSTLKEPPTDTLRDNEAVAAAAAEPLPVDLPDSGGAAENNRAKAGAIDGFGDLEDFSYSGLPVKATDFDSTHGADSFFAFSVILGEEPTMAAATKIFSYRMEDYLAILMVSITGDLEGNYKQELTKRGVLSASKDLVRKLRKRTEFSTFMQRNWKNFLTGTIAVLGVAGGIAASIMGSLMN